MRLITPLLSLLLITSLFTAPVFAAGTDTPATAAPTQSRFSNFSSQNNNGSGGGSGATTGLLVGGAVIGAALVGSILATGANTAVQAAPTAAAAAAIAARPFLSAGGYVVGPVGACLQLDGGVGLLFHLLPDSRFIPLVPPDYIWSPTTFTVPIPERPPVIGQYVLGLVYPNFLQGICIKSTFPFVAVGGWKFIYMGESLVPAPPGAIAALAAKAAAASAAATAAGAGAGAAGATAIIGATAAGAAAVTGAAAAATSR
jgi:hypothetical protein